MIEYTESMNIPISHIIKLRFDVIYNPEELFDPSWLTNLTDNTIIVPSTEFHCTDRWNERNPSMWPEAMCDQIVCGTYSAMNTYFSFFTEDKMYNYKYRDYGIETLLADYLHLHHLKCATFDLQISQPGGKYVLGKNSFLPKRQNIIRNCIP
jgi:hypothetical protein